MQPTWRTRFNFYMILTRFSGITKLDSLGDSVAAAPVAAGPVAAALVAPAAPKRLIDCYVLDWIGKINSLGFQPH